MKSVFLLIIILVGFSCSTSFSRLVIILLLLLLFSNVCNIVCVFFFISYRHTGNRDCRPGPFELGSEPPERRGARIDSERHGQGEEHGRHGTHTGSAVAFGDDQVTRSTYTGIIKLNLT